MSTSASADESIVILDEDISMTIVDHDNWRTEVLLDCMVQLALNNPSLQVVSYHRVSGGYVVDSIRLLGER